MKKNYSFILNNTKTIDFLEKYYHRPAVAIYIYLVLVQIPSFVPGLTIVPGINYNNLTLDKKFSLQIILHLILPHSIKNYINTYILPVTKYFLEL